MSKQQFTQKCEPVEVTLEDGDYIVVIEVGIGGYRTGVETFSGTKEAIGEAVKAYVNDIRDRMHDSGEEHGDLREFAPMLGDNYITYNDYDDVSVAYTSIQKVTLMKTDLNYKNAELHEMQDHLNGLLHIEE